MRKITVIGPSCRFLSGISYATVRLSNALAASAQVNTVLFRNMLPLRLFPGWRRVGERTPSVFYSGAVKVREVIDWYNPLTWIEACRLSVHSDIIIFQWWTSSVAHMYLAIGILVGRRVPIIIEFHEVVDPLEDAFLPLRIYSRIMGALIRSLGSVYVAHTEADKALISSNFHIDSSRIQVIPVGLFDHHQRIGREEARAMVGPGERVILFFGLLRPYKGVSYLIEAFERLPPELIQNSRLLIVGETWEDHETRRRAETSRFSSRITVVDRYLSDDEVDRYFSAADVLVIPYLRASQSGVALIGMVFGLPIVASAVGGLNETLGKYDGTFFVRPGNPEELADALGRVLSLNKLFKPPSDLRWEIIASSWIGLYDRVIAEREAGHGGIAS
jgi:glycosyltransferase involved in cell wall biosynthesis